MRRMKRHNPKRRKPAKKRAKRRNPAPIRRRRRRNPEAEGFIGPIRQKRIRSADARIAELEAKLAKTRNQASAKLEKEKIKTEKAALRAAKGEQKAAKAASKRTRKVSSAKSKYLTKVRKAKKAGTATPSQLAYLSAQAPKRAKRKAKQLTRNQYLARSYSGKNAKKASKAQKGIVRAWKSVKSAQKLAVTPKDRRLLSAMGLAGVPNSSMGGMFKDISALLPSMGVSAVSLAIAAVAGQMISAKIVPADKQSTMLGKVAPSAISLGVGLAGYMALRKSKSMGKFAPWVLAGGVAAAAVHAIARITVKDSAGAPVSLGKRLGLPIGEYASMAGYGEYASMAGHHGMGEYASMAGGTAYSGSRGVFSGLDDNDPVLSGTDDEDEVDMLETDADEGVNSDEGSLNGSIFD